MPVYKAPVREIRFVLEDLFGMYDHYAALPGCEEATPDLVNAIIDEGAKFCENVLLPLNQVGDEEGCKWDDGKVTTPTGFKAAYEQYVEGGWPSLSKSVDFGGQGLPNSLGLIMSEMVGTANWAWGMYPGLSAGCMETIQHHGTDEQKGRYLPSLISGEWTGTMCLTEPHCGTDLGLLRTKAEPNADGGFKISGTKIFISAGEHDMSSNIVHIVLARLPGAPEGSKGITLFIVPKFQVNEDGSVGEYNNVSCGSIEHKMGIHGNATCVMNFDEAIGYQIGPDNRGLACMFTFMNHARMGVGIQGLCHTEFGFQNSLEYARDRIQGRSLTGPKAADKAADPIIVHPDVRRMLLTQKSIAEGARALIMQAAQLEDIESLSDDEETRKQAGQKLSFLTPIVKGFLTEVGFECSNHALQCLGGHGFITEWGLEQNVRDSRISLLYEGTTGIQALDLLGRKVMGDGGEAMRLYTKEIHKFCEANQDNEALSGLVEKLAAANKNWGDLTMHIGAGAMENADEIGAASVDFLMLSGYVCLAYIWALSAAAAQQKLAEGTTEQAFYQAKLATADFYFKRILPRTEGLTTAIKAGAEPLMALEEEAFLV